MRHPDPVIGIIEIDADPSTTAAGDATLGELLQMLRNSPGAPTQSGDHSVRHWQCVDEPDGQTVQILCADLTQLRADLGREYRSVLQRLLIASNPR